MKYFIYVILLCMVIISSCNSNNNKANISDKTSDICNTSLERADKSDKTALNIKDSIMILYNYATKQDITYKYTFLEFGSIGCAPCKQMEKEMETIRNKYAGTVNVRFLNLTLKWSRDWAEYFNIQSIPTQVILDSSGNEIYRHTGYIPASELEKAFE